MKLPCCFQTRSQLSAAVVMLALSAPLFAQAPPTPAVEITHVAPFDMDTWPADINEDEIIDLVGATFTGRSWNVVVSIGRGDGTFAAARSLGVGAAPIGVDDFNGDGKVDIVVSGVAILPGNGDGTFGAPRPVTGPPAPPSDFEIRISHALAADFNGDGTRDLALLGQESVDIHPGNGDFTFGPKLSLPAGDDLSAGPRQGTVADFNGDNRPDIAVAIVFARVDVFINRGGLLFDASSIAMPAGELWDIAAGDLNSDTRADLLVASTALGGFDWSPGFVRTLLGNGNGTFQAAVDHATGADGSLTLVVGDFNADGRLDAATGNRSWQFRDFPCAPSFHYWDSVSILAGGGDGTFAGPSRFHLDFSNETEYRDTHNSLETADVDGDGRMDLIASPGAILLNIPDTGNLAPTLNAGPDRMVDMEGFARFEAIIGDPKHDMVSIEWTDATGRVVANTPEFCTQFSGSTTLTVTVTDARGDSTTKTVSVLVPQGGSPHLFVAEPDRDDTVSTRNPFTILWEAGDDPRLDTFDLFSSVDNGETWTSIAECTNLGRARRECRWNAPGPASEQARIRVVAYDNGVLSAFAVSDRFLLVDGPATSLPDGWISSDVGAVGAPGSATFDGSTFTVRGSGADIWDRADEFHYGFTLRGGDFDVIARVGSVENVNRWTKAGVMIRNGLGAGQAHLSLFATPSTDRGVSLQTRTQDGDLSTERARIPIAPPVWLKLMRRGATVHAAYRKSATDPWTDLPPVDVVMSDTVQVGLAVSSHVDGTLATATFSDVTIAQAGAPQVTILQPAADMDVRAKQAFRIIWEAVDDQGFSEFDVLLRSEADGTFEAIPECTNVPGDRRECTWNIPDISGPHEIKVIGTDLTGLTAEARSGIFHIETDTVPIPEPWVCGDVGAVGTPGACRGIDGEDFKQIEVDGSGADIWSTADEFSFARQEVDGDFAFTARVNSVENINRWTKAGLMIRDFGSGSAGSRHASFFVTPTTERGTAFQRRPSAGGVSVHTAGPVTTAPIWLRLVRTGDVIRAFYRKQTTDPWTPVGEQQFTGLPSRLSAMLVVSSHVDGTLATANFESVVIDPLEPMQSIDIGTTAPGSTQTNGTTMTIDGDGADIWGAADGFRFHYTQWTGDGTIIARVRSLENTNAWAKAGVMIREGLQPGARHVFALVSAGKGVSLQHRSGVGGITAEAARTVGTAPVWVRLTREGNRIAAFYTTTPEVSPDGHLYTWESLGEVTIGMTAEVFVGLAVTSHASGTLATAVFDDVLIRRP